MSEDDKPRGEPAVKAKAKIPNAKSIRSPEFTPHGISAGRGSGPSRPSGLTAAQARKRRIASTAGVVVVLTAIIGGTAYWVTRPGPDVSVSGKFATEPKVKIPKSLEPADKLKVTTSIKGSGPAIADGDTMFVKYVFYQWSKTTSDDSKDKSTSKELGSSYQQQQGQPDRPLVVGKSGVKGLDKGLIGQTAGSRVVLEIPPSMGFGE